MARIELGAQNYNMSCSFDGQPSVGLSVYQRPDANALDVADAVRKKMEELKTRFPDGLDYAIGYDTTPFIRESVQDVVITMLEAVALVGLVVLVFLQDWKAMILPMIDVPVSIIGTFAVMAAMGFSLNNISLFGLVLAIGIVVDDAIVVLENIERMLARGHDVRTATIKAMEEVTGPIIAVALVLCAVFVPCAFISGITGQFFRQFALTISVSTVISAINAITMTPSRAVLLFKTEEKAGSGDCGAGACARNGQPRIGSGGDMRLARIEAPRPRLRREALPWWIFGVAGGLLTVWLEREFLAGRFGLPAAGTSWTLTAVFFIPGGLAGGVFGWLVIGPVNRVLGWSFRKFNHYFDRMSSGYAFAVGGLLRVCMVVLAGLWRFAGTDLRDVSRAPTGFIPQQDQGRLIANIQLPDSASLERTEAVVAKIEKIARGDPNDREHHPGIPGIAHTVAFAGSSFLLQANSSNFASMFIVLDPFDKRQKPELRDTAIMNSLNKACAEQVPRGPVHGAGGLGDPGPGHRRRIQVRRRGPRRPGLGGPAAADRRPDRKTEEGPRAEPGDDAVPRQDAAALPRHRPRQGRLAGRVAGRREPDLGYFHGLELRQQFQRFRPSLAGHGPGRRDLSQPRGRPQPVPGAKHVRADGAPGHPGPPAGDCRPDRRPALQPLRGRPPSAATSRPAPARARPSRPSTTSPPRPCPFP